jgi:predicted polyphosphate/ATP-dependent NAD kinase
MVEKDIKILIFVGGDGTARDILDVVEMDVPVIAIPSGVKMFSSAFVVSAYAAAEMINTFGGDFIEKEILDIDEEAFRDNRLDAKYYGTVKVPDIKALLQGKKAASNVKFNAKEKKKEVAKYIVENMKEDWVYILGPGTTLKAIADEMVAEKTLLGIDAVYNNRSIGTDINEKEILDFINEYGKAKIIVTPIGGSGYIFGRGSRQISSNILKKVGRENIIIVSTLNKVGGLECLRIDSGDYEIDKDISGYVDVVIGYNEELTMEVRC